MSINELGLLRIKIIRKLFLMDMEIIKLIKICQKNNLL